MEFERRFAIGAPEDSAAPAAAAEQEFREMQKARFGK